MVCEYYQADQCRSCNWIAASYAQQIAHKEEELHTLLDPFEPQTWLAPVLSQEKAFRNKAKMQVLGFAHAPVLGIVNHLGDEVSLCQCPLYSSTMQEVLAYVESWIKIAGITPYRIDKKKGELKYILLSQSQHNGEMMLRFVLRSQKAVELIKKWMHLISDTFAKVTVMTANIQPVHMAILEGEEEIFLTQQKALKEYFNKVPLYIRPKSFFQTNPYVASQLYKTAALWSEALQAKHIWDLFCGVGGFGLHCANNQTKLMGIEIEAEAINCAKNSAKELGLEDVSFSALDARLLKEEDQPKPELIIVNPPRRGLGKELSDHLVSLDIPTILYSSCNAQSLAEDLKVLKNYTIKKVQLFDMFPHTAHYEVLVLLQR